MKASLARACVRTVLACVALAGPATAQWTVDASGGGDFTDLQAAIDAAAPHGILRVLPGQYGNAVLAKPLTIAGDTSGGGAQPVIAELDVQAAATFTLSNLGVARLRIAGGSGRALVDRCTVGPGAPWNAPFFGWSAFLIDGAGDVLVQRSNVVAGGTGAGGSGYTALVARASDVQVVATTIQGGSAPSGNGQPGRGGDAVHLWGGSRGWFAGSDLIGGAGEDFQPSGGSAVPGSGGTALRVGEPSAAAWADVRGSQLHELRGGLQDGTSSGPFDGAALRVMHACASGPKSLVGAVTTVGALDACADAVPGLPWTTVEGPVGPGQLAAFSVYGSAGAPAVLVLALAAGELTLPNVVTAPVWLDASTLLVLHPLLLQGDATAATLALPQPAGTALAGLAVHVQAFELAPAALLVATNASALVLGY